MNVSQFLPPLFLCAASFSCTTGDLVFATRSSIGVEVAGDQSPLPDHLNFGYRRREFIAAGDRAPKRESTLARLDVESSWGDGLAVRETFATGSAAERIAGETTPRTQEDQVDGDAKKSANPVVFASRTRVGLAFVMPLTEDNQSPSLLAGYSRRIFTVVRSQGENDRLPSVAADMSLHTSGINPKGTAPSGGLAPNAQLSGELTGQPGRARIRQFFALGKAADRVSNVPAQAKALAEATTGGPLEENPNPGNQ